MNNTLTGAVGAAMFLFFIFATAFLAGECAAAGGGENKDDHHHVVLPQQEKPNLPEAGNSSAADAAATALNDLKKVNEKFVTLLYEPLQKECDPSLFEGEFSAAKKTLCDTMGTLNSFVPHLKTAQIELNWVTYFSAPIRDAIHEDVQELRRKYHRILKEMSGNYRLGYKIRGEVNNIGREKLFTEFNKSYDQFMAMEGKEAAKGGETNAGEPKSHQEIVYKLLLIGERVGQMLKQTNVEDAAKQALAYQQFAVNLTIHSIHIGISVTTDGKIHDIREIALKWHQMLAAVQKLKEENAKFIELLYEPLKEECEQNRFTYAFTGEKQSLCQMIEELNKFVPDLKTAQVESNDSEIADSSQKIRDAIHSDTRALINKYYRKLHRNKLFGSLTGITKKVGEIGHEDLLTELKRSYDAFVTDRRTFAHAFELLLIGQKVAKMFKKSNEAWEQQALAYQQFAINLTIHSNLIGHVQSKDGKTHDIRAIAQKWPEAFGKLADAATAIGQNLINLKKENEKFVKLLYEPLEEECDTNLFEDESLCLTVNLLTKSVSNLKTKPNKTDDSSLETICAVIHSDADHLRGKYERLLNDKMEEEILKKVHEITYYELISKYKESYEEFMEGGKNETSIVFKLLYIGERVAQMFQKTNVEEWKQQALAYQQFAINLTIHSIHSGYAEHKILAIAEEWPMHMQWEKLEP